MINCLQRVINISLLESRLQEKYEQKGQVDILPIESQPDPTEALDVVPPTSEAHIRNDFLKM